MSRDRLDHGDRTVAGQQPGQLVLEPERVEAVGSDAGHGHLGPNPARARATPPRPRPTSWRFMASLSTM